MGKRHISVRLFTFDNHPPQEYWSYYQIWVGGLVTGRGLYVTKPETDEADSTMRWVLKNQYGYNKNQIEDIMNFIYKKL